MGGRRGATLAIAVVGAIAVPLVAIPWSAEPEAVIDVVISEVMTSNRSTLFDPDGESSDWIELWNRSSTAVDLTGWQLSDDGNEVAAADENDDDGWSFPRLSLAPGDRMVIFASGKADSHRLHASFRLSADGEYLALQDLSDNIVAEHQVPALGFDISYGLGSDGKVGVLAAPTPGLPNTELKPPAASKPTLSQAGGYIDAAVSIAATTETEDATLWYTTDGSTPTTGHGTRYNGPIFIDRTTTLRVIATGEGLSDSLVASATFLVMSEVLAQRGRPRAWNTAPASGQVYQFGFDQEYIKQHRAQVAAALLATPTLSVTTDQENLTGETTGIYSHPASDGRAWERPASVEFIDGDSGFQINGGIRLKGGHNRRPTNPKHSFQLVFELGYEGALDYPLLGPNGPQTFASVELRTEQTSSWQDDVEDRRQRSVMIRDQFIRDSQAASGVPSTRSRWVHLFLNGQYWGLYMLRDQVTSTHARNVFGGSVRDYDVLKHSDDYGYAVQSGNDDAWLQLWDAIEDGVVTDYEYDVIASHADLANLATFMLVNFVTGNMDSAPALTQSRLRANNWQAVGGDGQPFHFYLDDGEFSMGVSEHEVYSFTFGPFPVGTANEFWEPHNFNPGWLHEVLLTRPEYITIFRDRAAVLLADDGPLGPEASIARWRTLRDQMDALIEAEAARWGYAGTQELGRSEWEAEVDWIESVWLLGRTRAVIDVLVGQGILAP